MIDSESKVLADEDSVLLDGSDVENDSDEIRQPFDPIPIPAFYMDVGNHLSPHKLNEYEARFYRAMDVAYRIFQDRAFRKYS